MFGGRHPNPNYYATDRQIAYLKSLRAEAHRNGFEVVGQFKDHYSHSRKVVSNEISTLVAAKAKGWK